MSSPELTPEQRRESDARMYGLGRELKDKIMNQMQQAEKQADAEALKLLTMGMIRQIRMFQNRLTADDRIEFWSALAEGYCAICGKECAEGLVEGRCWRCP